MSKTPSIAVIPSGYKASKVYSVLPTNGDADLDFTRNCVATRVNQNGLLEEVGLNVPRLDYSDGGCPSLLLEPQRTNLVTYSEDFSQDSSGGSAPILTTGQLAPDGTLSATKVSGVIGSTSLFKNFQSSTTATRSIYARTVSGTGTASLMSFFSNTNNTFTITEEWQRFELTGSIATGGDSFYAIDFRDSSTTLSEVIIWGCQSEEGSYATSYIPTNGATVTRFKDEASKDNLESYINSSEGVFYAEISAENDGTFNYISLSDGGVTNYASILYTDINNEIIYRYYGAGTQIQIVASVTDLTSFNKIAIKWKLNDFAFFVNGFQVGTATLGEVHSSGVFDNLSFARGGNNNTPFYGKCKDLRVYNEALTDVELITLTTI